MVISDEPEPARVLPALPDHDQDASEIRWDRWEPAIAASHIDPRCPTCAFAGPLSTAFGKTWYTPEPTTVRVKRSSPGQPSQWAQAQHDPYWCKTHYAVRCPQCDEMTVYRRSGWVEIYYRPPTTERAVPQTDDNVLF
ncbi:hypothetical protein ABR737_03095 [Streptomyces sp. Edi2]|uniref:hypothetical protein n=1 Tax=unclassified Streptomyces TaxID=2593676 RepID=UPI003305D29A